jgi:hypothetical protein
MPDARAGCRAGEGEYTESLRIHDVFSGPISQTRPYKKGLLPQPGDLCRVGCYPESVAGMSSDAERRMAV